MLDPRDGLCAFRIEWYTVGTQPHYWRPEVQPWEEYRAQMLEHYQDEHQKRRCDCDEEAGD